MKEAIVPMGQRDRSTSGSESLLAGLYSAVRTATRVPADWEAMAAAVATSIHDHTAWCVVAVIAGSEREERFRLNRAGDGLELTGTRIDRAGTVSSFARRAQPEKGEQQDV